MLSLKIEKVAIPYSSGNSSNKIVEDLGASPSLQKSQSLILQGILLTTICFCDSKYLGVQVAIPYSSGNSSN